MSQFDDLSQPQQPPPKSSSGLKIVLWILGIGGGLCLLACGGCVVASIVFFKNTVSNDPATVQQTAEEITEIEVISGYDPLFSFNLGMTMVAFGQEGDQSGRVLMLMAFPEGMGDEDEMRRQMNQSMQQQGSQHELQEIESETRTYTIRGQECDVQITRAEAGNGLEVRQITTVFTAKDGRPAMLMLIMPEEDWINGGEQAFESMLQSMQ